MAGARKFLLPVRQIFFSTRSSAPASLHSIQLLDENGGYLKKWFQSIGNVLYNRAATSHFRFYFQRKFMQDFCSKGSRVSGSVLSASVLLGCIYCWPRVAHAMDGLDVLEDDPDPDPDVGFSTGSDADEDLNNLLKLKRRLWLSILFMITVFVNRTNPITFAVGLLLFLNSTKPTPSSIYVFVEQLRHQLMRRKPYFFMLKSLYANKVEVKNCFLFCLAIVEIGGQKYKLVGILGDWWMLPSSVYFPSELVF